MAHHGAPRDAAAEILHRKPIRIRTGGDVYRSPFHLNFHTAARRSVAAVVACAAALASSAGAADAATTPIRVNWIDQSWSGPVVVDGDTHSVTYELRLKNNSTINLDLNRFHVGIVGDAPFPLPSNDLSGDRNRMPCVDGNRDDGIAGIGEAIVCNWTATVRPGVAAMFRKVYFEIVDDGGSYGHVPIPERPWLPVVAQTPQNPYPEGLGNEIGALSWITQAAITPSTPDGYLILSTSAPTGRFLFVLRNTSSLAAIFVDGPGVAAPARLGTVEPQRDAPSAFLTPGDGYAITTSRVKADTSTPIMPDHTVTFVVRLTKKAGMLPGRNRLALEPVIDGLRWLPPTSEWVPIEIR